MKKDKNLANKNIHSNNSSGKSFPNNSNFSKNQSPYNSTYRGRSPNQRNHHQIHLISHKTDIVDQIVEIITIETTIQDRIQADHNFRLKPVPI